MDIPQRQTIPHELSIDKDSMLAIEEDLGNPERGDVIILASVVNVR